MIKNRISFVAGALLASGLCLADDAKVAPKGAAAASAPAAASAARAASPDLVTINDVAYPLSMFELILTEQSQGVQIQNEQQFAQLQQRAFDVLQTLAVASQEAQKRKLQDTPDVTAAIAAATELQRLKVLANAAFRSMAQETKITDDELKQAYDEAKKEPAGTEFKVRHILLKDEAEAKKIIKELEKGADFGELAKKKSVSTTVNTDGGDLGWFNASQKAKPIADAVAQMKPGTYSKEPVKTDYGWEVIQLQETRPMEPPSFDAIKPRIVEFIQRQKLDEAINKLRAAAKVEINEALRGASANAAAPTDAAPAIPAKKDDKK